MYIFFGEKRVVFGIGPDHLFILIRDRPDFFRRRTEINETVFQYFSFRNKRMRSDNHIRSHDGMIKDNSTDADQASVTYFTTVERHLMPANNIITDNAGRVLIYVNKREILNIGISANPDEIYIAAKDGSRPNTGVLINRNIADDYH